MTDSSEAEFEEWWKVYGAQPPSPDDPEESARAAWSACAEKAEEVAEEHNHDEGCKNMDDCKDFIAAEIRRRLGGGK